MCLCAHFRVSVSPFVSIKNRNIEKRDKRGNSLSLVVDVLLPVCVCVDGQKRESRSLKRFSFLPQLLRIPSRCIVVVEKGNYSLLLQKKWLQHPYMSSEMAFVSFPHLSVVARTMSVLASSFVSFRWALLIGT